MNVCHSRETHESARCAPFAASARSFSPTLKHPNRLMNMYRADVLSKRRDWRWPVGINQIPLIIATPHPSAHINVSSQPGKEVERLHRFRRIRGRPHHTLFIERVRVLHKIQTARLYPWHEVSEAGDLFLCHVTTIIDDDGR